MKLLTTILTIAGMGLALSLAAPVDAGILLNLTNELHYSDGDAEAQISPGHSTGAVTGDDWNQINTGFVSSIVDDAGNTLTGVTVDVGARGVGGSLLDYSLNPTFHNLGAGGYFGGVYNSNAQSAIFYGSGGNDTAVGVRIAGLDAGLYTIYATARNTNKNESSDNYNIYVGTVAFGSGSTDYSGFTTELIDLQGETASWVEGDNYVAIDVNLSAGDDLVIVFDENGDRGFLNTVEILLVPEPGSLALLGLGGLCMLARCRRNAPLRGDVA